MCLRWRLFEINDCPHMNKTVRVCWDELVYEWVYAWKTLTLTLWRYVFRVSSVEASVREGVVHKLRRARNELKLIFVCVCV